MCSLFTHKPVISQLSTKSNTKTDTCLCTLITYCHMYYGYVITALLLLEVKGFNQVLKNSI